ncbi:response regulator transcription factor [Gleimia hominis]|uniref:Response regulator transcription factor n=1 Tax=Gleimia hominis TaxID=595468 RepID=A0ABU3IBG5_9ACTO|nr:response regulator transcription factor [Gleimia hominis]MDT3767713.1 response regulator transcription factor [Gleimia hominis]
MEPLALVVDDEIQIRQIVTFALSTEGIASLEATDGHNAWLEFCRHAFNLVILDLMLPDISGITLCKRMRAQAPVPILMLTALGESTDRIIGLEAGADDYLVKPFSPRELALRARNLLARNQDPAGAAHELTMGNLRIDTGSNTWVGSTRLALSETETRLLAALMRRGGELVSVRELINEVWNTTVHYGGRNMVKTTVYRLRKKLTDAALDAHIVAVRNRGYALVAGTEPRR